MTDKTQSIEQTCQTGGREGEGEKEQDTETGGCFVLASSSGPHTRAPFPLVLLLHDW